MTHKQALTKAYQALSPYADPQLWEFHNNLVHLRYITKHVPQGSTILDVGCGIGIIDIALSLLGYVVTGVDKFLFEENNVFTVQDLSGLQSMWQQQGIHITSKDILTESMDETYDAVISIATIEHQKDPKGFIEGLLKPLKKGGVLYIATPSISHVLNRVRFIFGRSPMQAHLPNFFKKGEQYEGHWREYTLRELMQMYQWLHIEILEARNIQSMKPKFSVTKPHTWHKNLFRLLAYMVPGARDTNSIVGKK